MVSCKGYSSTMLDWELGLEDLLYLSTVTTASCLIEAETCVALPTQAHNHKTIMPD